MKIAKLTRIGIFRKTSGFTLVEIAVVLMIIGLLLGGLIPTLSTQLEVQRGNKTQKQLNEIKEAIIGFAVINGRLPWPACGTIATGQANAGIELALPASAALCTTGASDISVLPWATLGVEETDAWGRRFSYRVTPEFADNTDGTGVPTCTTATGVSFQLCSNANLNVKTTSGGSGIATNVPAVVVSHGVNGLGAYQPGGGAKIGTATGDEAENADNNNTFVSKDQIQNGFDDLVVWVSPNTLANRMVTAGKLP